MHIYGKEQQAYHLHRTSAEKWFSRMNMIVVAAQLACFLTAVIRTSIVAGNSMNNAFFINSPLQLSPVYMVPDCVYSVTRSHGVFSDVKYELSAANVGYFVSRAVLNLRYLFAITGVHCAISVINRILFESNTHELRYHFVVFHKDMLTVFEMWLMIIGIVMTFGVNEENAIMQSYIVHCNPNAIIVNTYYNSIPPYIELYVSYFISIGFTFINVFAALVNLLKPNPRDEMIKEDRRRMEAMQTALLNPRSTDTPGQPTSLAAQSSSNAYSMYPSAQQQQQQQQPSSSWIPYDSITPMTHDADNVPGRAVRPPATEDTSWMAASPDTHGDYASAAHLSGVRHSAHTSHTPLPSQGASRAAGASQTLPVPVAQQQLQQSPPPTVPPIAMTATSAQSDDAAHSSARTSADTQRSVPEENRRARTSRTVAGENSTAHPSVVHDSAQDTVLHERLIQADEDVNASHAHRATQPSHVDASAHGQAEGRDAVSMNHANQVHT